MKYTFLFIFLASILFAHAIDEHFPAEKSLVAFTAHRKSREELAISSPDGMTIVAEDKTKVKLTPPLLVEVKGRRIKINGNRLKYGTWHLIPHNGKLIINEQMHDGSAILHIKKRALTIFPHKNIVTTPSSPHKATACLANPATPTIRALIHELLPAATESVTIKSLSGFIFYNAQAPHHKKECNEDTLQVMYKENKTWINNQVYDESHLRIIPKDGYAGVNSNQFHGSLSLVHHNNRLLVINHVDLEEYVYAVLKAESWPGWPLEVNKAFAIASRSYAMATMKQANKIKQPYHIKNTSEHQNYKGMHTNTMLRTAVEETRGMCVIYQNEPILAMFDCCCGGIIPAQVDHFDFTKVPYLARTYPCKHCKRSARYAWKKEWPLTDLDKQLTTFLKKPVKTKDFKIAKKDKAGLVHELALHQGKDLHTISAKQFYQAFKKDIKSFCYTVQRKKDTLVFSGRGMGHHLGICQWGAREMVRDGWPYHRILSFYYPGTSLMKLS